jgi:hypothetical protein
LSVEASPRRKIPTSNRFVGTESCQSEGRNVGRIANENFNAGVLVTGAEFVRPYCIKVTLGG